VFSVSFVLATTKLVFSLWVSPLRRYRKLKSNGFSGPTPSFPLGNLNDMKEEMLKKTAESAVAAAEFSNDVHSVVFPYFSRWQKLHGKVFVYWLGTEAFVYMADAELVEKMSEKVKAREWGKPDVFKDDRDPMFGKGLLMVEGDDWVRHRNIVAPAFSPHNLKAMGTVMLESGTKMVDRWTALIDSGRPEIDVEAEIIRTAGEIIARASFGMSFGESVLEKLRELQIALFESSRHVGVPFGRLLDPKRTLKARSLGREIDAFLLCAVEDRMNKRGTDMTTPPHPPPPENDLLGLLLAARSGKRGGTLTKKELVDECKTFFFGGHETTALTLSWTLLLLARHPEWQHALRDEIAEAVGEGGTIDATAVVRLRKMGWVLNEALRLYPSAPNVQRQARHDIRVDDRLVIPKGTNIWVDIVSIHHDPALWGDHAHDFDPQRWSENNTTTTTHGHRRLGFLPFGLGGRTCVGRNLTLMEYKIVLSLILSRFSFSVSPAYKHSPGIMLSLRPLHGIPLIFSHL
ncbi:hypothetical protein M569_07893, partial [Genlisea aurea]